MNTSNEGSASDAVIGLLSKATRLLGRLGSAAARAGFGARLARAEGRREQLTQASNKAIARRLGISFHTAKFHVAAILAKAQCSAPLLPRPTAF